MNIHLKFNSTNGTHTRMSLFVNNKLTGNICMSPDEADWFHETLSAGAQLLSIDGMIPIDFISSGIHRPDEPIPPVPVSRGSRHSPG